MYEERQTDEVEFLQCSGVASTTSSPGHRLGSEVKMARAILATPFLKHTYARI